MGDGDERFDEHVASLLRACEPSDPVPLSIDTINEAMRQIYDDYGKAEAARAARTAAFLAATPEPMRHHPFVQTAASVIGADAIFHPAAARAVRAELDRLAALTPEALVEDAAKFNADLQQRLLGG